MLCTSTSYFRSVSTRPHPSALRKPPSQMAASISSPRSATPAGGGRAGRGLRGAPGVLWCHQPSPQTQHRAPATWQQLVFPGFSSLGWPTRSSNYEGGGKQGARLCYESINKVALKVCFGSKKKKKTNPTKQGGRPWGAAARTDPFPTHPRQPQELLCLQATALGDGSAPRGPHFTTTPGPVMLPLASRLQEQNSGNHRHSGTR